MAISGVERIPRPEGRHGYSEGAAAHALTIRTAGAGLTMIVPPFFPKAEMDSFDFRIEKLAILFADQHC